MCNRCGKRGGIDFRLIYEYAGCKKPFKRLWLSSMEDEAIREGFKNLKPSYLYDNLYLAAKCRQEADWLVGMNGTRLFSLIYGGGTLLRIGRVQTPTLNIINERDNSINNFIPEKYYHGNIIINGINFKSIEKYKSYDECFNVLNAGDNIAEIIDIEIKNKRTLPPKLFDLTLLQRTANKLFGYTASKTLEIAQSLYEKKLITYPRTDSNYLTEDMENKIYDLISAVLVTFAKSINSDFLAKLKFDTGVIVNNKKVTDHHAIIPTIYIRTNNDISSLSTDEANILKLISFRLVEATSEPMVIEDTKVIAKFADEDYEAKSNVVVSDGYKKITSYLFELLGLSYSNSNNEKLMFEKGYLPIDGYNVSEHVTSPPEHYSEDTLLNAMEKAGNREMERDVERKGLGTSATRAAIIEKLVKDNYVERKRKKLLITDKGKKLISVLPEEVKSVQMTVNWENKLLSVSKGEYSYEKFMSDIRDLILTWVANYSKIKPITDSVENEKIGTCPACGSIVFLKKTVKGNIYYGCSACDFKLWENDFYFSKLNKKITKEAAKILLSTGRIRVTGIKSKKTKRNFSATVYMTVDNDCRPKYEMSFK